MDTDRLIAQIAELPAGTGLLLDVDGTLAPIVARPGDAAVPAATRDLLRDLAGRYALVACVSGRPEEDARRVVRVDGLVYVGEHGLGLTQLHAEASSLLAIIPTVIAGTWRQQRYGNVRWRSALWIGLAAIGGVEGGVALAESLPEHALRRLFGVLMFAVAAQIAWRARKR